MGRPPATTSAETRARILASARKCFGQYGYEKTTNKDIATEAGITTGAIYHYFDSKPELFAAVARETDDTIFTAFADAAAAEPDAAAKINAVLRTAIRLHQEDRSLAAFASTAQLEVQRHPDVNAVLAKDPGRGLLFFRELVDQAIADGDVAADVPRGAMANMLVAATMGLAQFAALVDNVKVHRDATEAFMRLIEGSLFTPVERPLSAPQRRRRVGLGTRDGRGRRGRAESA